MTADAVNGPPIGLPRKSRLPFSGKAIAAVAVALAFAAGGVLFIASPSRSVSTDNAYVQADSTIVAPKVRGLIAEVLVQHNQSVRRGDPLIRIDAEEFDAKVKSADADLLDAKASVASAHAALISLDAEERLAASNVRAARSTIRSADAQSSKAEADRKRYDDLILTGAVAHHDVDQFRAAALSAAADAEHSRAELDVSRNQASVTHARRMTLEATLAQAEAGVARAEAALELARQDQDHTVISAAIDGVVGDRQVEPGDYVEPGTRLLTIVPMQSLYVIANFKETQTARMRTGQSATLEVDALPGVKLVGDVESFAPGSGSQFALLPFEPGTGNFTKIVQRVPVRLRFAPNQAGLERLRPGLSTTATVTLDARSSAAMPQPGRVAAGLSDGALRVSTK